MRNCAYCRRPSHSSCCGAVCRGLAADPIARRIPERHAEAFPLGDVPPVPRPLRALVRALARVAALAHQHDLRLDEAQRWLARLWPVAALLLLPACLYTDDLQGFQKRLPQPSKEPRIEWVDGRTRRVVASYPGGQLDKVQDLAKVLGAPLAEQMSCPGVFTADIVEAWQGLPKPEASACASDHKPEIVTEVTVLIRCT